MKQLIPSLLICGFIVALAACDTAPKKPAASSSLQADLDQLDKPNNPPPATGGSGSMDDLDAQAAPAKEQTKVNPITPPSGGFDETYRRFNEARQAGSFPDATAAAANILTRNPNDVKVLNALGVMAINQEKYDLARLYLKKVMEKDPNNAAAYNNLGVIELKNNNLRLALEQFKKATMLDGHNRSAHANLGAIYLQYRNYPNAVVELESAVDSGDQSPATLSNYGYALTGAGEYSKAQDAYEKAMSKDESNIPIMLNYAALMVQHNLSREKAIRLLNKIRFVAHEPGILRKVEALLRKVENAGAKAPPVDKGELD